MIDDIELVGKYNQLLEDLENMVIATQIIDNKTSINNKATQHTHKLETNF